MRRRDWLATRRAFESALFEPAALVASLAVAATVSIGAGVACGGGSSAATPVPSLASSPASGQELGTIREALRAPETAGLEMLRVRIGLFLVRWPNDGLVPLAHVYLALIALDRNDLRSADRELPLGQTLPPGTTRDLWTVASAKRLRLGGDAEGALLVLRPLVGKTVEPLTRAVFQEELALSALATHRDYEAISYMDAWLRAASDEDGEQTRRIVTSLVEKLPKDVLLGSLQAMRAQRASLGYGDEIERILGKRLVAIATTSGDAELARALLDADAGAIVVQGEAGAELGELATSRRGMNVVEGRTLGLLLPTELPALRD
jgi:hypothetical protein